MNNERALVEGVVEAIVGDYRWNDDAVRKMEHKPGSVAQVNKLISFGSDGLLALIIDSGTDKEIYIDAVYAAAKRRKLTLVQNELKEVEEALR